MSNQQLTPQDNRFTMMSVSDSRVIRGSLWKLLNSVILYDAPEKAVSLTKNDHVGNCIIVVLDVVRNFKFGPHVWVHVLSPNGAGYINRVHFNSDGAAMKCI